MIERPLEYASLKAVLLHMDANVRFQVSNRMPSIRNVEKGIPLRISHLKLSNFSTSVNGTHYNLGVYQDHLHWYIPEPVNRRDNEGCQMDFDEFGFRIFSGKGIILPGDVSFCQIADNQENEDDDDQDGDGGGGNVYQAPTSSERYYREDLRFSEKAQEIVKDLKTKGISVRDYLQSLTKLEYYNANKEEWEIREKLKSIDILDHNTAFNRVILVSYECRRNKTKPPFVYHIQLTIKNGEKKKIQKFEYNKKLFEATKELNQILFGGRVIPIHVGHLELGDHDGIYRLPTGFRLRAHKVDADAYTVTHRSFPRLVENSENLGSLRLSWMFARNMKLADFQNQIVQKSERLEVCSWSDQEMHLLIQVFKELPNLEISIKPRSLNYPSAHYFELIQAWLTKEREIGSSCWIKMGEEEIAREVLKLAETQNEGTKQSERSITFDINGSKKCEVSYDPYDKNETYYQRDCKCILKMRIVNA